MSAVDKHVVEFWPERPCRPPRKTCVEYCPHQQRHTRFSTSPRRQGLYNQKMSHAPGYAARIAREISLERIRLVKEPSSHTLSAQMLTLAGVSFVAVLPLALLFSVSLADARRLALCFRDQPAARTEFLQIGTRLP